MLNWGSMVKSEFENQQNQLKVNETCPNHEKGWIVLWCSIREDWLMTTIRKINNWKNVVHICDCGDVIQVSNNMYCQRLFPIIL